MITIGSNLPNVHMVLSIFLLASSRRLVIENGFNRNFASTNKFLRRI